MKTLLVVSVVLVSLGQAVGATSRVLIATGDDLPGLGVVGESSYVTPIGFFGNGDVVVHAQLSDGSEGIYALSADGATRSLFVLPSDATEQINPELVALTPDGQVLIPTHEFHPGALYHVDDHGVRRVLARGDVLSDGSVVCGVASYGPPPLLNNRGDSAALIVTQPTWRECERGGSGENRLVLDAGGSVDLAPHPVPPQTYPISLTDDGSLIVTDSTDFFLVTPREVLRLFGDREAKALVATKPHIIGPWNLDATSANRKGEIAVAYTANLDIWAQTSEALFVMRWRAGRLELLGEVALTETFDERLSISSRGDVLYVDTYVHPKLYFPEGGTPIGLVAAEGRVGEMGEVAMFASAENGRLRVVVRYPDGTVQTRLGSTTLEGRRILADGVGPTCLSPTGLVATRVSVASGKSVLACIDAAGIHPMVEEGGTAASDLPLGTIRQCQFLPDGNLVFSANEKWPLSRSAVCDPVRPALFRATSTGIERIVGSGTRAADGSSVTQIDSGWFSLRDDGSLVFTDNGSKSAWLPSGVVVHLDKGRPTGSDTECKIPDEPTELTQSLPPVLYGPEDEDEDEDEGAWRRARRLRREQQRYNSGSFELVETATRAYHALELYGPPVDDVCRFVTPAAEYSTRTPTPTPTRTPTPSRTPTRTWRPTATRTFTATATPTPTPTADPCNVPGACARLSLATTTTARGFAVTAGIEAGDTALAALQVDLVVPGVPPGGRDHVLCKINPFVAKPLRYYVQPSAVPCDDDDGCAVVRVLIVSTDEARPLPNVDPLFTCRFRDVELGAAPSSITARRASGSATDGRAVQVRTALARLRRR